jgi:hypothetical protein
MLKSGLWLRPEQLMSRIEAVLGRGRAGAGILRSELKNQVERSEYAAAPSPLPIFAPLSVVSLKFVA